MNVDNEMNEQRQHLITRIKEILKGIDLDESIDDSGWWETSTGAAFGAYKLKQIIDLLTDINQRSK